MSTRGSTAATSIALCSRESHQKSLDVRMVVSPPASSRCAETTPASGGRLSPGAAHRRDDNNPLRRAATTVPSSRKSKAGIRRIFTPPIRPRRIDDRDSVEEAGHNLLRDAISHTPPSSRSYGSSTRHRNHAGAMEWPEFHGSSEIEVAAEDKSLHGRPRTVPAELPSQASPHSPQARQQYTFHHGDHRRVHTPTANSHRPPRTPLTPNSSASSLVGRPAAVPRLTPHRLSASPRKFEQCRERQ